MNTFNEVKRILEFEHEDISICSERFFLRYCKKEHYSDEEIQDLKDLHDKLFPYNSGSTAYVSSSDLGAVVGILGKDKEADEKLIWGYIAIDHYGRPTLIPKTDYKLQFKGEYNLEKVQAHNRTLSDHQAYQFNKFFRESMKPMFGKWLDFSWASDLEMNFTINYPAPRRSKNGGGKVSGLCWRTTVTDNEMRLVKDIEIRESDNRKYYSKETE